MRTVELTHRCSTLPGLLPHATAAESSVFHSVMADSQPRIWLEEFYLSNVEVFPESNLRPEDIEAMTGGLETPYPIKKSCCRSFFEGPGRCHYTSEWKSQDPAH
jgi:hypothetical protein